MSAEQPPSRPDVGALLTKPEAANYLQVSLRTLARLIRDQEVDVVRIGGSVRFTTRALDDYADRNTQRARANQPRGRK